MPQPREWRLKDAIEAINAAIKRTPGDENFKRNQLLIEEGDHWQNGDTWVGPDGGSEKAVRQRVLQAVSRQFTPVDVVSEVLDNVANALLQREASVTFTPLTPAREGSPEEKQQQEEIDRMRELVSHWWDKRKLWKLARKAVRRAKWGGRGALRCWIQPATLVSTTQDGRTVRALPKDLKLEDALDRVRLYAPDPSTAHVFEDEQTGTPVSVFTYKRDERDEAEIWYVDENGTTVLRRDTSGQEVETFAVNLGGRLPIAEMEAEVLVTPAVRQQQNRLNFFESLLVRVGETAGFPERYTLNAKPQGVWLKTKPENSPPLETYDDNGVIWYLHPAQRALGAAITTDLRGLESRDGSVATPGVAFKDPTDPEYAIKASQHARMTILRSCKQGHLAANEDAAPSGYSREVARAPFATDVENTRGPLEGMLRDTIEAAIALAEVMAGAAGTETSFLKRYRCVVNVHVNVGPISPEERNANVQLADKNYLSRESAMAANGVEDVAAELARIDAQPETKRRRAKELAEAIKALTDAGAGLREAALLSGLTEQEADQLVQSPFVPPRPDISPARAA